MEVCMGVRVNGVCMRVCVGVRVKGGSLRRVQARRRALPLRPAAAPCCRALPRHPAAGPWAAHCLPALPPRSAAAPWPAPCLPALPLSPPCRCTLPSTPARNRGGAIEGSGRPGVSIGLIPLPPTRSDSDSSLPPRFGSLRGQRSSLRKPRGRSTSTTTSRCCASGSRTSRRRRGCWTSRLLLLDY